MTSTDGPESSREVEMDNTATDSMLSSDNTMIYVVVGSVAFVSFLVGTVTTLVCVMMFYWKISSR